MRIDLSASNIRYAVNPQNVVYGLLGTAGIGVSDQADKEMARHIVDRAMVIKRRGQEARIVIASAFANRRSPDQTLIDTVCRANALLAALTSGDDITIGDVADRFGMHRADVSRLLPLAFLSSSIVEAIRSGTQPVELSTRVLTRLVDLPAAWSDQAALLGA